VDAELHGGRAVLVRPDVRRRAAELVAEVAQALARGATRAGLELELADAAVLPRIAGVSVAGLVGERAREANDVGRALRELARYAAIDQVVEELRAGGRGGAALVADVERPGLRRLADVVLAHMEDVVARDGEASALQPVAVGLDAATRAIGPAAGCGAVVLQQRVVEEVADAVAPDVTVALAAGQLERGREQVVVLVGGLLVANPHVVDDVAPCVQRPEMHRACGDRRLHLAEVVAPDAHVEAAAFALDAVVEDVLDDVLVDVA